MIVKGILIAGHGVASGKAGDNRYPEGTIKMQFPFFLERGLDLSSYFLGTLNIDISPLKFEIIQPKYFIENIGWSTFIPPENFYFFDVQLIFKNKKYSGLIYLPDPKTKTDHPQKPSMLELIMPKIENLNYAHVVEIEVVDSQLKIF